MAARNLKQKGDEADAGAQPEDVPLPVPDAVPSSAPDADQPSNLQRRMVSYLVLVVTIGGSIWLAFNPQWILRFGSWGYAGAFVISLISSASVILPVPGLAVAMALGTALNPFILGVVTGVASALGEITGYLLGRSGGFLISGDQQRNYQRLEEWTRRHGSLTVFVVALLPIPFFDLAGIAAGAMQMPLSSFLVATALGKTLKYTILILLTAGWFAGLEQWLQ